MQRLEWGLNNFALGMHTDMARAGEGAERFARHAAGVRVDEFGHLRPRVAFKQFGELRDPVITGVVAGADYLLYLRADASLWIRFADDPTNEREILFDTLSTLTGALSLIGDFADFLIIKGQGGHPYWIDMREDAETYLHANRLGIEPPTLLPSLQYVDNAPTLPVIVEDNVYFYRWTFVRAFGVDGIEIRDGVLESVGTVMNGMESNPSVPIGVYRRLGRLPARPTFVDNDGNEFTDLRDMPEDRNGVVFIFTHSIDPQVTGIMLYQSEPVDTSGAGRVGEVGNVRGRINVDALEYRRIAYIPKGTTVYQTGPEATSEFWPDRVPLRFDNDVMPETERIHLFNDRIFVPTEQGLRFSDIDGTVLRLWAFPETHAIRRSGVKDVVSHRGVLLFGGPADLHTLTGASAFDFVVNRLGTVGPVSPHAMQVLKDTVAFAGSAGFYVSDGVQVQKISAPLDTEFEDYESTYGHCHQLPDESIVFIVQQRHDEDSPRRMTYHFDGGGWFSWPRFNIHQIAHWRVPGSRIMMADQSHALRELVWKVTPLPADDSARDHEDWIEWSWQSQRLNFGTEDFKAFREIQLEIQALSVIPQGFERWDVNWGPKSVATALTWSLGGKVLILGDAVLGGATVPVPVRLTIWVDDLPPHFRVFEAQRESLRPIRIPINRKGRAITIRLEGRGHLQLKRLRLIGVSG